MPELCYCVTLKVIVLRANWSAVQANQGAIKINWYFRETNQSAI